MAGIITSAVIGVSHGVDKYKQRKKNKQKALAEAKAHDERENRFNSEKERLAAEDRRNAAAGEGSSSGPAAPAYYDTHPALRSQAPQLTLDLPSYEEAAASPDSKRSSAAILPPYGAPMSPNTEREFESYLAARQTPAERPRERSPGAPEDETEEERRKRKYDEFWKFRGGGWWSMVGYSMVRGFATL